MAAGNNHWIELKRLVVEARKNKFGQTIQILRDVYKDQNVICISEASVGFLEDLRVAMGNRFEMPMPNKVNTARDQNSFLLLNKEIFGRDKFEAPVDITAQAQACVPPNGVEYTLFIVGTVLHMRWARGCVTA